MTETTQDQDAVEEFTALMQDPAARQAFVELKSEHAAPAAARRYSHVLQAVAQTPWAITRPMLAVIMDILRLRAAGVSVDAEELQARVEADRRRAPAEGRAGVAVVPLTGVLVPKASMFSEVSGGTSMEEFRSSFRQAMAMDAVKAIVLDVDSPGGMVDGIPEMAAELRSARGRKPVVAVANSEMASAAYWLGAQADEVIVSPSSRVGSIGVYSAHEDESARAEMEGVRTTLVSAGKFKTEGNPFGPLDEDARGHIQSMVDEYYDLFVRDVARGRRVGVDQVRGGYGEGRVLTASQALGEGLADGSGTVESTVKALLKATAAAPSATFFEGNPPYATSAAATGHAVQYLPASQTMIEDDRARQELLAEANVHVAQALQESEQHFSAEVDNSEWDGNAAMSACDDAACYRAICAGRRDGDPSERQSWALPHHKSPGSGPNAAGTRNALARLPQTQGLTNREAAQRHLEAHMREVNPEGAADVQDGPAQAQAAPAPADLTSAEDNQDVRLRARIRQQQVRARNGDDG